MDDVTWTQIREYVNGHHRIPRQASQRHLLSGLLRCPNCGARMHGRARAKRARSYRCSAGSLGANAAIRHCPINALSGQVDEATLHEVHQLVDAAATTLPELRHAIEAAWAALREPTDLQDKQTARRLGQLQREANQARMRLTNAAVLFADGDIDKKGYDLLRDKARTDLDAAETEIERLHKTTTPVVALPPLEEVLEAAGGWGAVFQSGDISAQRSVLATLIDRVEPVRIGRGRYSVTITWTPLGQALRGVSAVPVSVDDRPAA